jgi:hypothetical protein
MATTTNVPDDADGRDAPDSAQSSAQHSAHDTMHGSVPFTSTCPKCHLQRVQQGFSRAALGRLLKGGYPIEGYCASCGEFWPIGPAERVALAIELGSTA